MKVFLMFMAFMLLFTGFLVYSSDLSLYMQMQRSLKDLSEDCAAAGSLVIERDQYGMGLLEVDEDAARQLSAILIGKAREKPMFSSGSIESSMKIYDDVKGYEGIEDLGLSAGRPAVLVTLVYSGPDIFRLRFLKKSRITRSSVYQWEY